MAGKDNLKPFKKGDPRINRKGRPKGFDKLRELAKQIANEEATANGQPIIIDNHKTTTIEMLMRDLVRSNPKLFLEYAYGKVPDKHEVTGKDGKSLRISVIDYGLDMDEDADDTTD